MASNECKHEQQKKRMSANDSEELTLNLSAKFRLAFRLLRLSVREDCTNISAP